MKKIKIFLVLLIIANIILSSILVIDIQLFKSPDILLDIDVLDVNSEEIELGSNIQISNPNGFDLIVSDLEVISRTENGEKVGNIKVKGGNIPANKEKKFYSTDKLSFSTDNFEEITNTVYAKVGVNILGIITKTIPLKITAIASFDKVFDELVPPDVNINFDFDEITEDGLNFSTSVDIYNPTSFDFSINNIFLDINDGKNENFGNITVDGNTVESKSSQVFSSKGTVDFSAFDSGTLFIDVTGVAGAKIAGVDKNISFSADASFNIPSIESFVFSNESIDFSLPVQFKITPFGFMGTVGLRIYNPSNVPLVAKDLVCSIYRLDNEKLSLLAQEDTEICEIAPKKAICIKTQILIPYSKYIFSGSRQLIADWIVLKLEGDFSIEGTYQVIPISLEAFVDPHFLRNSDFTIHEE